MDNELIFIDGTLEDIISLRSILTHFCASTSMEINEHKSCLFFSCNLSPFPFSLVDYFPFPQRDLDLGFKYLGFSLKPNAIQITYWSCLIKKVEAHVFVWDNFFLKWRKVNVGKVCARENISVLDVYHGHSNIHIDVNQEVEIPIPLD